MRFFRELIRKVPLDRLLRFDTTRTGVSILDYLRSALAIAFCAFGVSVLGQGTIWEETFSGQTGKGIMPGPVTNMADITTWSVTVHDTFPTNGHFRVSTNSTTKEEYFEGCRLGGECVWQSQSIDISSTGPVDLSLQLQETGTMAASDTIGIYYRLDDSNEVQFVENGFFADDYGSTWITASQPYLRGMSVVIVVRMQTSVADKKHRIDNVRVTETAVPSDQPPELAVEDGKITYRSVVGETLQFTLTATENLADADTDRITLWAAGLPAHATFPQTNGLSPLSQLFSWAPVAPGTETISFFAADKDGTNRVDVTITVNQLDPGHIWINEIHYDNAGGDAEEGIEIAGPAGYELNGHKVYFYNGADGTKYSVLNLSGVIDNEYDRFGALWFPHAGIQNGAPDGLALVRESGGETKVLQFLSYEGTFIAADGPAIGLRGVDIGVAQPDNTPIGQTLQLTGKGKGYADFTWTGPVEHSRGSLNAGQQIARPGGVFIVR